MSTFMLEKNVFYTRKSFWKSADLFKMPPDTYVSIYSEDTVLIDFISSDHQDITIVKLHPFLYAVCISV